MKRFDYDPSWWLHNLETITPKDIRRVQQEAIDDGADPAALERLQEVAIAEAGGTIEDLARSWTDRLQLHRGLADFGAAIRRNRAKPPQVVEAEAVLRELIQRYPGVVRDVLAGEAESDRAAPAP
ncbi:hypothetical protein [Nonomuraea insulae]|uniref:Uncharacterized protein n=1 Tax=Nonomuraea insulae TaxID=1616787 RepID=A0ABW1CVL5_9ACTN